MEMSMTSMLWLQRLEHSDVYVKQQGLNVSRRCNFSIMKLFMKKLENIHRYLPEMFCWTRAFMSIPCKAFLPDKGFAQQKK